MKPDSSSDLMVGAGAHRHGVTTSRMLRYAVCTVIALSSVSAFAQQQAASSASATPSAGLEEIVVTSQRREERIQNVPIAVTAFTAETMQSRNLTDIHSLGNLTPGVNLDSGAPFSGDRSVLSASIRGIGQDDFAFNLNPGVGVYVDGVYLARTIGANQNLLDVDRVEILKGPQGTLFGANTIGGAISIVTHTPGEENRFIATVTGGSYDRRDFGFTADIPIIPGVLLSTLSVSSEEQTGWMKVVPYPANSPYAQAPLTIDSMNAYPNSGYQSSDNYGGKGLQVIRGKLLWNINDKASFTFGADWSHEDTTALGYTVLNTYAGNLGTSTFSTLYNLCISNGASTITGAVEAAGGPPFFGNLCSQPRARVAGLSNGTPALLGAGYVGGPVGPYNYLNTGGVPYLGSANPRIWWSSAANQTGNINTTYAADGPDFARYDAFGTSATGVFDLGNNLTLKSITAYRQIDWRIGTSESGQPGDLYSVTDHQHQIQVSQEFQLLGKALDNKLNYLAGLYYFDEFGYVHDFVPFEGLLYVTDFDNTVENKNMAVFAHADYAITDKLGFTAGGRYTTTHAYFTGGQADLNNFPFGGGTPLRYYPPVPDSQTWNIFDPTVGLQYHFDPDVMGYLSWGKGFKAGGWTTRLSAPLTDGNPANARFNPEYSKTWELGLKSQWFDHRLQANAALFYTNYDGIQLNIQRGISPVYSNAGDAIIKGAELELNAVVARGLTVNFAGSYIDAYYTSVNPTANFPQYALPDGTTVCPNGPPYCGVKGTGSALDAKLPKTPKYKLTLDPVWDIGVANGAIIRFIPAFTYTAELFNDSLNTPELRRPATKMLDASLHYISPSGQYDVAIGGTNLVNDRFIMAGSPNYGAGAVDGYYNDPREWYATIRVKFDNRK